MRGAIILCGGRSTRMGSDKAALPFGLDETMLARTVRLVAEVVPADAVVCVAGADQWLPELPTGVEIVRDTAPDCGPLAGLVGGLRALADRADAAFACGCDVPLLVPAVIGRMFDQLNDHEIAAPYEGEHAHPLAAVYRLDVLPVAESLLASGERSLVALVNRCDTRRVDAESLRDVDPDLLSLAPCNSPEEYRRALRTSGFPG